MRKNANYMIRYYYTSLGGEYNYTVDDDNRKINISMINGLLLLFLDALFLFLT